MFTKNQIQLTGNITKSAELREVGDSAVASACLIHNERIRRADGETVERRVVVDLDIWGRRGEAFSEYVTTKTPVFVEGRLQMDEWEHDGEPWSTTIKTPHLVTTIIPHPSGRCISSGMWR